jgi:hypothetical protein
MRERGFAADQDCAFMNLIDDWTHLIDMAECRSRYAEIMRERRQARRNTKELAVLQDDSARTENDPNSPHTPSLPPTT